METFLTTSERMERVKYESYAFGFIAGVIGTFITLLIF